MYSTKYLNPRLIHGIFQKGKFFSLKFDGATRLRTHYLGVTVQFFSDDGLKVKTLALVDTKAFHDSQHLSEFVLEVMKKFRLPLSHCLSCVVDNAANMTKTIELINTERRQQEAAVENRQIEDEAQEVEEEEEEEMEDEQEEGDERPLPNIDSSIHHTRCAAHTLQLGIEDALKTGRHAAFIEKLANVAQKCRAPKLDSILKRRTGKGALMRNRTRWGSSGTMAIRLLELKEPIKDLASGKIYEQWRIRIYFCICVLTTL